jgi:hypothetical protein
MAVWEAASAAGIATVESSITAMTKIAIQECFLRPDIRQDCRREFYIQSMMPSFIGVHVEFT